MTGSARRYVLAVCLMIAAACEANPVLARSAAPAAAHGGPPSRTATVGPLPKPAPEGGYLSPEHVPDAAPMLGPPPTAGSGTETGDVDTFLATRKLKGGERWALATRDAVFGADALLQDFSCALGVQLTAANAPTLQHLLSRVVTDSGKVMGHAKSVYRRPRPFVDHPGAICVAKDAELAGSWSYPSGHSTYSWTVALILAEAAPDRATEILARARTYGESRVVCGVHYTSDVEAGRVAASAVFSALQAEPAFQRDLKAVRSELASLQATGGAAPDAKECRIEDDAVAHPAW